MSADKKLKCFYSDGEEAKWDFEGSNSWEKGSNGLESWKNVKKTFTNQICPNCNQKFSLDDFYKENYDLWINRKISFINEGDNGYQINNIGLQVVFYIAGITHKDCEDNE